MSAGKKIRDRPRFRQTRLGRLSGGKRGLSLISQKGFTYLALLIAVAIGGAVLATIGELTSHAQQREKEADLLFVGHAYRQAIGAYYERAPGGAKRYPQKLEDMLEDKRHPMAQRYLRKLYADPITGKAEWGLMEAPGGGIMGVYSLSEARPVKSGGFSKPDESFIDAMKYADWKFFYAPATPSGAPATDAPNAPGPAR
jgi:type II secretory pathway pseudopilin PulG